MIGSSAWVQKADVTDMTHNCVSSLGQMSHPRPSGDEHPAAHAAYCEGIGSLITDLLCRGSCAGSCSECTKGRVRSAAQLRWRRVRCRLKVAKIIETLLHDVRGQQIEQLYSVDWSEPTSASELWAGLCSGWGAMQTLAHVFSSARCQIMGQLCDDDRTQYLRPKAAIQVAQGKVNSEQLVMETETSTTHHSGLDYGNECWDCEFEEDACRSCDAYKHATAQPGTGFPLLDYPLASIESYLACCVVRDDA